MTAASLFKQSGATFSDDRVYRYTLWRQWSDGPAILFVALNPSTADETANDATVERLERRARMWGYGKLVVANIFAVRATDPRDMLKHPEPIGPGNDDAIIKAACDAQMVVCCWGGNGKHLGRGEAVRERLTQFCSLHALKVTNDVPHHPLYLSYKLTPFVWAR